MTTLAPATAAVGVAAILLSGCTTATTTPTTRSSTPARTAHQRVPVRSRPLSDALVRRRVVLGFSVAHRPIVAEEVGDPDSLRRALVVGCTHGNEPGGIAIARALARSTVPHEVDLWVVPDLNPDGVAGGTRANAHGVDLNRNFPGHWRPLGPRGSTDYAGPRPLSEPESRAMAALLTRLHPTLGLWYHQALNVVDDSQGPAALERRYATDTGMPLQRLTDYPGSAVGYEDQRFGPSAFVVELPGGRLSRTQVDRHVRAALDIAERSAPSNA
jgi:protein MpaA